MSALLLLTKAWSSEIVSKQLVPEQLSRVEAIVTKVEQESLTLRPMNNEGAEISISRKNDGTLQIGDKVVIEKENLRKVGVGSPGSSSHEEKEGKEAGTLTNTP
jgi:hypothetical protein